MTVLWQDDSRHGRVVTACSPEAAKVGVRMGMPLVEADLLVRASHPDAMAKPDIRQHDPLCDGEMLYWIADALLRSITPKVAIEPLDPKPWAGSLRHQPESLVCDITGLDHLFRDEPTIIAAIDNLLQQQFAIPLFARIAVAPNVAAAWAMAHFGEQRIETTEEPISAIAPYPIESLRLPLETAATLQRLGVESVEQLLRLPRSGLATRLGQTLVARIAQAIGEIEEPMEFIETTKELSFTHELEYPTRDFAILMHRMGLLLEEMKAGLATRKHGAVRLQCRLDFSVPPPQYIEIGLFAPSQDSIHLRSLIESRFESLSLRFEVLRLSLSVPLTAPLRTIQPSLLENDSLDSQTLGGSAVSRFVDRISSRLGRNAVSRVKLTDDPLPENRHVTVSLTGHSPQQIRKKHRDSFRLAQMQESSIEKNMPSPDDAMRRPLTLIDPPLNLIPILENQKTTPNRHSQVPISFEHQGKVFEILCYWGPERIETGWWSGPTVRRDYFRVETSSGAWWWIYRDITATDEKQWFLHGLFS